jgi:hypothetical protein
MAVARSIQKKSPSQAPADFFSCKQSGGTHGGTAIMPDKQKSGSLREKIFGRKTLGKKS